MTDSQWPRFQVFEQRKEGAPHQNAGTLHASDGEMALMMARDLFVRRPTCIGLWVVPSTDVFARSAEQLDDPAWREDDDAATGSGMFRVFTKTSQAGTHTYLGNVEAAGAVAALEQALEIFADTAALVWWVVPDSAFTETVSSDAESLFAPARDKTYRDQAEYHTVTLMREIRMAEKAKGTEE